MLSIADALHWMFVQVRVVPQHDCQCGVCVRARARHTLQGCVVVLKHSPVRAYNHTWMSRLFQPLVDLGFFGSVLGDVDVSQALVYNPMCDRVHLTGGTSTHDAIVWGPPGAEAQARRRDAQPLLKVPMTSELGAVTPWLIVPGSWSKEEMKHHTLCAHALPPSPSHSRAE